jgi:DNA polymerase-4
LSLKVRYSDFTTITRSCTSPRGFFEATEMLAQLPRLLAATEAGRRMVRLLGVTVSSLFDEKERQVHRRCQLPLPFPPGRFFGERPSIFSQTPDALE